MEEWDEVKKEKKIMMGGANDHEKIGQRTK
jgi:hypothetical protein